MQKDVCSYETVFLCHPETRVCLGVEDTKVGINVKKVTKTINPFSNTLSLHSSPNVRDHVYNDIVQLAILLTDLKYIKIICLKTDGSKTAFYEQNIVLNRTLHHS